MRILLVDDDPELREVMREGLEADGFAVVEAADGASALARVSADAPYDVVVLDHEMPGLRGLEVLETLRARGDGVPVLLVSGSLALSASDQERLGIGPVLVKPVSLRELSEAIRARAAR